MEPVICSQLLPVFRPQHPFHTLCTLYNHHTTDGKPKGLSGKTAEARHCWHKTNSVSWQSPSWSFPRVKTTRKRLHEMPGQWWHTFVATFANAAPCSSDNQAAVQLPHAAVLGRTSDWPKETFYLILWKLKTVIYYLSASQYIFEPWHSLCDFSILRVSCQKTIKIICSTTKVQITLAPSISCNPSTSNLLLSCSLKTKRKK